jgi:hypothetical protein
MARRKLSSLYQTLAICTGGMCVGCQKKPAVTNDRRFCEKCLKKAIERLNPMPRHPSDEIGRKQRDWAALGGEPF